MQAAAVIVLAAAVSCLLLSAWLLRVGAQGDTKDASEYEWESAELAWGWWKNKRMREGKAAPKRRRPKTGTGKTELQN